MSTAKDGLALPSAGCVATGAAAAAIAVSLRLAGFWLLMGCLDTQMTVAYRLGPELVHSARGVAAEGCQSKGAVRMLSQLAAGVGMGRR